MIAMANDERVAVRTMTGFEETSAAGVETGQDEVGRFADSFWSAKH